MGWPILAAALLLVVLLLLMPVGVRLSMSGGLRLSLRVGPVRARLFPRQRKKRPKRGEKETVKAAEASPQKRKARRRPNRQQILFSLDLLLTLLRRLLRRVRRGLWVEPLDLRVVFGGEDPADVAALYGRAQAAVSALFAVGDSVMNIREARISLQTDYNAPGTTVEGEVGVQLRVGSALLLAGTLLRGLIQWAAGYRRLGVRENQTAQAGGA